MNMNGDNNVQNIRRDDNDSKKIFTMLVLVFTLMICTTGATYAYFALSASATNNITGTAASGGLILTNTTTSTTEAPPSLIAPATSTYNTLPMIPQISYTGTTNVLQNALTGASGKDKCVDANGNVICRAYTFVIRNQSTAAVDVRGYVQFSYEEDAFHNLKWKLMDSATTVSLSTATSANTFSTTAPINAVRDSKVYFDTTNVALAKNGGNKQYWLIVWIEEINKDQSAGAVDENNNSIQDSGSWYATVGFEAFDKTGSSIGGLTSTITS